MWKQVFVVAALNVFPRFEDFFFSFSRTVERFLDADSVGSLRWLLFSLLFDDRSLMSLSLYSSFILPFFFFFFFPLSFHLPLWLQTARAYFCDLWQLEVSYRTHLNDWQGGSDVQPFPALQTWSKKPALDAFTEWIYPTFLTFFVLFELSIFVSAVSLFVRWLFWNSFALPPSYFSLARSQILCAWDYPGVSATGSWLSHGDVMSHAQFPRSIRELFRWLIKDSLTAVPKCLMTLRKYLS